MVYSESLDPDTAPRDRSIWRTVDRTVLECQTTYLSGPRRAHVPDRRSYEPPHLSNEDPYPLQFDLERGLADDFAFVAASEPRAVSVSAVAIEQSECPPLLRVRLAANEGISPEVKRAFDGLFRVLRDHATKNIGRDECQTQLFDLIVRLNCNKILGRLGSARFRPPAHLKNIRGALPVRIQKVFRDCVLQTAGSVEDRGDYDRLKDQIYSFESAFSHLEKGNPEELMSNLKYTIKRAYELTGNGVNLPVRLGKLGCPDFHLDAREVREVGKVANYWRISRHLAVCSQKFRRYFADATWYPLVKYTASSRSRAMAKQFVHAEIQLLVYYETNPPALMPRAIGASKEACFLCDSFIQAHGRFFITAAHRQVSDMWTVPDLEEYDWQTVDRFRRALSQVCIDVKEEYMRAQLGGHGRLFPLQSAINLRAVQVRTPSAVSFLSQPEDLPRDGVRTMKSGTSSAPSTLRQQNGSVEASVRVSSLLSSEHGQQIVANDSNPTQVERPLDVTVDGTVSAHEDWVHLSASFWSPPEIGLRTQQQFNEGRVHLKSVLGDDCPRMVNLDDIPSKDGLVIQRDSNDATDELSFILIRSQGQRVCIRCQWYI